MTVHKASWQYRSPVNLADTPSSWQEPEAMSMLHALLFFAGIPLLIVCVITLLVMAPSLVKGNRHKPSQDWDAPPEWFGGPESEDVDDSTQLTPGPVTASAETGGASARW